MSVSFLYALAQVTVATSLAIFAVALARRPLGRIAGAQIAYWLWLLVPASAVAALLPASPQASNAATRVLPWSAFGPPPATAFSGDSGGAAEMYAMVGVAAWAVGTLLMLALMLRRQRAFIRSLGKLVPMPDGTHRSAAVRDPLLIGIWQPRIVLPPDFESVYDPEERALVLAHEHAHRKRGDLRINSFATLWLCFFWFNPLSYWALKRLKLDQELACDAAALRGLASGRRRYADTLLKAQLATDAAWRTPVGCHWHSSHPLKERIAMLKRPLPGPWRRWSGAAFTCALIASGTYIAWAMQPATALAEEPQVPVEFSADRMTMLENGDIELVGNIVIRPKPNTNLPMSFSSASANPLPGGGMILEGMVRISFEGHPLVITTERATLENGVIRMDSARASRSEAKKRTSS